MPNPLTSVPIPPNSTSYESSATPRVMVSSDAAGLPQRSAGVFRLVPAVGRLLEGNVNLARYKTGAEGVVAICDLCPNSWP